MQFWKLWLNLCSRKRLSPRRSRVLSLIPLWLQQLKKLLGVGLKNLRILLLKIPKLSASEWQDLACSIQWLQMGRKCFWKSYVSFSQGNTINISCSIRKCKKPSIFENFLVVESFFWSNYRLTIQSSDYIKMIPPRMFFWKSSAWSVPSIFEYFCRK